MGGLSVRKPLIHHLVLFLFGVAWALLSGCCGLLCNGLSGCGSGLLIVASPPLKSLNSPLKERPHCKRGGCGNGPDWWCTGPPMGGKERRMAERKRRTKRSCE